ncbi:hypothetical protein JYT44_02925 [Caldithrix abyssi]|nr:hypothetical protein [Caldithrix abyssi]
MNVLPTAEKNTPYNRSNRLRPEDALMSGLSGNPFQMIQMEVLNSTNNQWAGMEPKNNRQLSPGEGWELQEHPIVGKMAEKDFAGLKPIKRGEKIEDSISTQNSNAALKDHSIETPEMGNKRDTKSLTVKTKTADTSQSHSKNTIKISTETLTGLIQKGTRGMNLRSKGPRIQVVQSEKEFPTQGIQKNKSVKNEGIFTSKRRQNQLALKQKAGTQKNGGEVKTAELPFNRLVGINTGRTAAIGKLAPVNMVQRITEIIFHVNQLNKTDQAHYKVDAGQLGTLEIRMFAEQAAHKITIVVETDSVRQDLEKLLPTIKENLFRKGIDLSAFDVEVHDEQKEKRTAKKKSHPKHVSFNSEKCVGENTPNLTMNKPRSFGYNSLEFIA